MIIWSAIAEGAVIPGASPGNPYQQRIASTFTWWTYGPHFKGKFGKFTMMN